MNHSVMCELARSRAGEIRHQAARSRASAGRPGPWRARPAGGWPAQRRQIGFRLVEAGLHVLATTRP